MEMEQVPVPWSKLNQDEPKNFVLVCPLNLSGETSPSKKVN